MSAPAPPLPPFALGGSVELQATSNYSFLRGASHPHELFAAAASFGYEALAITDRNSVAGLVRAHLAARETGVRLIPGCRLDLEDAGVLVYPADRPAWSRLCRLLTLGKRRAGKGGCRLGWDDLADHSEGLVAVLLCEDEAPPGFRLARLKATFGDRAYLALTLHRRPGDAVRLATLEAAAAAAGVATVVTGDVLFHEPGRRRLQDVLTCIREGCTIDEAGFRLNRHADRHLKPPAEMARLFARHAGALARTREIAARLRFSLDDLTYQYPDETDGEGTPAQEALEQRTWAGARAHYGVPLPPAVESQLRHELKLIAELAYAPYFLTVHRIVSFAKAAGILCQGRGSAANSAVCFVLGITAIDPRDGNLLFERFISEARREPPDIDVDFEHQRREEVIQWIYATYGRDHAALTAVVTCYRARGAVRDVGKALGLGEDLVTLLAGQIWGWSNRGVSDGQAADLGLDLSDYRLSAALELARTLVGFPRHLSQHPGGFVLTRDRLDDLVPIEPAAMENRQVIEWDKDDIDILKFMKVDVLGLGMLGCLRRSFELLAACKGEALTLSTVPGDDAATYDMICRADTVGVFQIESRAQMAMLPRLKPRNLTDLTIEVAIVRPGPIQGDMVHPYLRRRSGQEAPDYPRPEFRALLERTFGVPLFQEQAMRIAIECAGFTATEADGLRRAMATFKNTGTVVTFRDKLIAGMVANGYTAEFAARTFRQLEGFGSYGFPESHAASFARLAYISSWLKCRHPEVFACALLNAQPMGFYAPAQIVRDARAHGVEVRPVDLNASRWDCTLEDGALQDSPREDDTREGWAPQDRAPENCAPAPAGSGAARPRRFALRLGLRLVKGLAEADGARLAVARGPVPYADPADVQARTGLEAAALERLAEADAFAPSLGLARREALWAVKALRARPLPLFAAADDRAGLAVPRRGEGVSEPAVPLARMPDGGEVVEDYSATGLSLRAHPVSFLRGDLARRRIRPCAALTAARDGDFITVAGLVLVRQRPGSARGVTFMTLEDETGTANVVIWSKLFERQRRLILSADLVAARGRVQREGDIIHVVARSLADHGALLAGLGERGGDMAWPFGRGDEARAGGSNDRGLPPLPPGWPETAAPARPAEAEPAQRRLAVKARNFH